MKPIKYFFGSTCFHEIEYIRIHDQMISDEG